VDAQPTTIAVTGGAGAVGRHLIRQLTGAGRGVRALVHRTPLSRDLVRAGAVECEGSLLDRDALLRWLTPGCAVVHLAWPRSMSAAEHRRVSETLAATCVNRRARLLVHVSTAVVAGRTRARVVTEDTPCEPATPYEQSKYEIEQTLEHALAGQVPLAIARPTAVFGPGLLNLLSIAESVRLGGASRYCRAALFGRRQLHLVPVQTVAAALDFLACAAPPAPLDRFIISTDIDPGGDYQTVERRLRQAFGARAPVVPQLRLPAAALRLAQRLAGRSDADPDRQYDGSKLRRAGFAPPVSLAQALDEFAAWFLTERGAPRAGGRS
jgi:nucleoside-diphosphate-sugar epimerase